MKNIYFLNLYEVKCSLGLVFLQYPIRYAESTQSLTNMCQGKCNMLKININNLVLFRVGG